MGVYRRTVKAGKATFFTIGTKVTERFSLKFAKTLATEDFFPYKFNCKWRKRAEC